MKRNAPIQRFTRHRKNLEDNKIEYNDFKH